MEENTDRSIEKSERKGKAAKEAEVVTPSTRRRSRRKLRLLFENTNNNNNNKELECKYPTWKGQCTSLRGSHRLLNNNPRTRQEIWLCKVLVRDALEFSTVWSIVTALYCLAKFNGKLHPIAEDMAYCDYRTWRNQARNELEDFSLPAGFHRTARHHAGCWRKKRTSHSVGSHAA